MIKKIAIFPIPRKVGFPNQVISLHIFEPRYRLMLDYCIRHSIELGICPPQKTLKLSTPKRSIKQAINSNHNLYTPQKILSCGTIELIKKFDDGRSLINLHLKTRVQIIEITQEIPFYLAYARGLIEEDNLIDRQKEQKAHYFKLFYNIKKNLYLLLGKKHQGLLDGFFQSHKVENLNELIFQIFNLELLPCSILQQCLEEDRLDKRGEIIFEVLSILLTPHPPRPPNSPTISKKHKTHRNCSPLTVLYCPR